MTNDPAKTVIENDGLMDIYERIHQGEFISLSGCEVRGFSLTKYREIYNLDKVDYVTVKLSDAIDSIFVPTEGSDICVDFSWAKFEPEDSVAGISFSESCFLKGIVDFSYISLSSDLCFDDCKFFENSVKFLGCKFANQDVSFYGADLGSSDFYFHSSEFKKGELSFGNSKNLGRVQIVGCIFDQRDLEFIDTKSEDSDIIIADINFDSSRICFTNSEVRSILCHGVSFFVKTDFDVASAEFIVIQNSIISDAMVIGNNGWQNIINLCFLRTLNLGKIHILNQFSEKLFSHQKKLFYPHPDYDENNAQEPSRWSPGEMHKYYEEHLDLDVQLCDTSYYEKAQQMYMLKENAASMGDYELEDQLYLLGRRYKNRSKIDSQTIQFRQLKNSESAGEVKHYYLNWIGVLLKSVVGGISFFIEKIFLDKLCGDYATKPSKFFCSVMLLIISFAGIYLLLNGSGNLLTYSKETVISENTIFLSLYFSLFQFFQIDCGISLSEPLAHMISLVERALGMIVLAIFTVSYTRKIIK